MADAKPMIGYSEQPVRYCATHPGELFLRDRSYCIKVEAANTCVPIERALPAYCEVEQRIMEAINYRFGMGYTCPTEVKDADTRILLDERAALMPNTRYPWDVEQLQPLGVPIFGMAPDEAEARYLAAFNALIKGDSNGK